CNIRLRKRRRRPNADLARVVVCVNSVERPHAAAAAANRSGRLKAAVGKHDAIDTRRAADVQLRRGCCRSDTDIAAIVVEDVRVVIRPEAAAAYARSRGLKTAIGKLDSIHARSAADLELGRGDVDADADIAREVEQI